MGASIVVAIITATATVFASYMTVKTSQSRIFSPYQNEYLERQIFEFLAPMDKILTFHVATDWGDIRGELKFLIEENYALVPPMVLSECVPLLPSMEISDGQFLKLKTVVASVYHWTRKEVGHSFDSSKIKKEFVPVKEAIQTVKTTFVTLFASFAVFATLAAVTVLKIWSVPERDFEQLKARLVVCFAVLVLYLCGVLSVRIIRKK